MKRLKPREPKLAQSVKFWATKNNFFFKSTIIYNVPGSSVGSRFYLSFSSSLQTLFASFPNEKVVLAKTVDLSSPGSDEGWTAVAGNSKPCVANKACGDGGPATEASLAYPKVSSFWIKERRGRDIEGERETDKEMERLKYRWHGGKTEKWCEVDMEWRKDRDMERLKGETDRETERSKDIETGRFVEKERQIDR